MLGQKFVYQKIALKASSKFFMEFFVFGKTYQNIINFEMINFNINNLMAF